MKFINVGYGNMASVNHIIAMVSPDSAPIKRMVQDAKERGCVVDATFGRRTRTVIVTDSEYIILSAIQPKNIVGRIDGREDAAAADEDEVSQQTAN